MTVGDWLATAYVIEQRRLSAAKYEARARHMRAFPVAEIDVEMDVLLLERIVALLKGPPHHYRTGFEQPHRGGTRYGAANSRHRRAGDRVMRLRAAGVGGNNSPSDRSEGSRS